MRHAPFQGINSMSGSSQIRKDWFTVRSSFKPFETDEKNECMGFDHLRIFYNEKKYENKIFFGRIMNNTCQVIAMEGVRQDKKIDQPGWPSFIIGKRSRHDDFRHRNIYESYRDQLRDANPDLFERLYRSKDLARARQAVYSYLETVERRVFDIDRNLHPLEKSSIRECTGVLKSVFGPVNEKHTDMSALDYLYKISQGRELELEQDVAPGFIQEFIALFRGILGKSGVYDLASDNGAAEPAFLKKEGREAAVSRSAFLDTIGVHLQRATEKYPSGLEREIVERREKNRRRILHYFGGSETDWHDFRWQIRHVIREAKPLFDLIELTASQQIAVENAVKARLPFGITPYYLSLMDRNPDHGLDHAVRAQVIPPPDYVAMMIDHRLDRDRFFDFMGEQDTSPVDLVTRRYPGIAILKPFNTCAQICVYCQRN
jgi:lysine 2,3-aminomutase